MGGLDFQKVSKDIDKHFNADLSDEELKAIRLKLDDAGVRMLTCFYSVIPGDEKGCRKVFEFACKMGIKTLISEPPVEALDTIERFCDEYDIDLVHLRATCARFSRKSVLVAQGENIRSMLYAEA